MGGGVGNSCFPSGTTTHTAPSRRNPKRKGWGTPNDGRLAEDVKWQLQEHSTWLLPQTTVSTQRKHADFLAHHPTGGQLFSLSVL